MNTPHATRKQVPDKPCGAALDSRASRLPRTIDGLCWRIPKGLLYPTLLNPRGNGNTATEEGIRRSKPVTQLITDAVEPHAE